MLNKKTKKVKAFGVLNEKGNLVKDSVGSEVYARDYWWNEFESGEKYGAKVVPVTISFVVPKPKIIKKI